MAPEVFATPLGLNPNLHLSTFSVRTGDRLLFFTDGLLEARDQAGRLFSVSEHLQTLRRPSLQSAIDELLDQVRAHPLPPWGRRRRPARRAHADRRRQRSR